MKNVVFDFGGVLVDWNPHHLYDKYFGSEEKATWFLENICLGSSAVGYRTESLHGAGSPQAQRIMIARQGNIQGKKDLAKVIAGIPTKE